MMRGIDPASGMLGFYGLDWNIDYDSPKSGRISLGHANAFSFGTQSYARLNPADGIGIVVLSSCWLTGVQMGLPTPLRTGFTMETRLKIGFVHGTTFITS